MVALHSTDKTQALTKLMVLQRAVDVISVLEQRVRGASLATTTRSHALFLLLTLHVCFGSHVQVSKCKIT